MSPPNVTECSTTSSIQHADPGCPKKPNSRAFRKYPTYSPTHLKTPSGYKRGNNVTDPEICSVLARLSGFQEVLIALLNTRRTQIYRLSFYETSSADLWCWYFVIARCWVLVRKKVRTADDHRQPELTGSSHGRDWRKKNGVVSQCSNLSKCIMRMEGF